ncbi:MAG: hypothetical protein ACLRWQ_09365 [Flavonifractor plautii]
MQARSAQTEADTAAARARIEALEGSAAALRAEAEGKARGQSELQARTAGIREAIAELNMRRAGLEARAAGRPGRVSPSWRRLRRDLSRRPGRAGAGHARRSLRKKNHRPGPGDRRRRNGGSRPSARRTGSGRRPSPASMRRSWPWRPGATRPTSRPGTKTANCSNLEREVSVLEQRKAAAAMEEKQPCWTSCGRPMSCPMRPPAPSGWSWRASPRPSAGWAS